MKTLRKLSWKRRVFFRLACDFGISESRSYEFSIRRYTLDDALPIDAPSLNLDELILLCGCMAADELEPQQVFYIASLHGLEAAWLSKISGYTVKDIQEMISEEEREWELSTPLDVKGTRHTTSHG